MALKVLSFTREKKIEEANKEWEGEFTKAHLGKVSLTVTECLCAAAAQPHYFRLPEHQKLILEASELLVFFFFFLFISSTFLILLLLEFH